MRIWFTLIMTFIVFISHGLLAFWFYSKPTKIATGISQDQVTQKINNIISTFDTYEGKRDIAKSITDMASQSNFSVRFQSHALVKESSALTDYGQYIDRELRKSTQKTIYINEIDTSSHFEEGVINKQAMLIDNMPIGSAQIIDIGDVDPENISEAEMEKLIQDQLVTFTSTAQAFPITSSDSIGFPFNLVEISIQLEDGLWLNTSTIGAQPQQMNALFLLFLVMNGIAIIISAHLLFTPSYYALRNLENVFSNFDIGERTLLPEEGPISYKRIAQKYNKFALQSSKFAQDQNTLINSIAHDLLTPISSIRIRTEFITESKLQGDINMTLDEIENMSKALLEAARGGASDEEIRQIDLTSIVEAIVDDAILKEAQINVGFIENVIVSGRSTEIRRMLQNVLDNAVNYGECVFVSLNVKKNMAIITLDDDGPGIPEEKLESMIKPFARLDTSRNLKTGGYGLGLSIANSIAERHGGALKLINRSPNGLSVKISLPITIQSKIK